MVWRTKAEQSMGQVLPQIALLLYHYCEAIKGCRSGRRSYCIALLPLSTIMPLFHLVKGFRISSEPFQRQSVWNQRLPPFNVCRSVFCCFSGSLHFVLKYYRLSSKGNWVSNSFRRIYLFAAQKWPRCNQRIPRCGIDNFLLTLPISDSY